MVSDVVKANVKFMISEGENSMRWFATTESQGGNASVYKGKLCVGINFQFESDTGKIVEFTNETDRQYSVGIFRLPMPEGEYDPQKKWYPRIVSCRITPENQWGKQATPLAEAVIQESVKLYNQCCDALERKKIFKWVKEVEEKL